mmetsp:Transcript_103939/g.333190  ORF Transcript_103939/g.333190 Transcript_103939/m.333190 type:complete len:204 (-) Transcript_103939:152-763(-)
MHSADPARMHAFQHYSSQANMWLGKCRFVNILSVRYMRHSLATLNCSNRCPSKFETCNPSLLQGVMFLRDSWKPQSSPKRLERLLQVKRCSLIPAECPLQSGADSSAAWLFRALQSANRLGKQSSHFAPGEPFPRAALWQRVITDVDSRLLPRRRSHAWSASGLARASTVHSDHPSRSRLSLDRKSRQDVFSPLLKKCDFPLN